VKGLMLKLKSGCIHAVSGGQHLLFLEDKVHEENRRILTNNDIYAMVKNPTITEPIRLKRL